MISIYIYPVGLSFRGLSSVTIHCAEKQLNIKPKGELAEIYLLTPILLEEGKIVYRKQAIAFAIFHI